MQSILEFFRGKKETFVKTHIERANYISSSIDEDTGTWWPSEWDEVQVQEIDWEAFEKAVLEFEASFQEGGENAWRSRKVIQKDWRNNVNKEN